MRRPPRVFAAGLLALAATWTGCGSSTKTVSVSGAPANTPSQTTAQAAKSAPPTSAGSTTASGGTPAGTATRSAPEPAFSEQEHRSNAPAAAAATLRARGYTPVNTSDYHRSQALEVLIGMHSGSGDGYGQQAFFFVNGRYIGTDASQPSATLRVAGQSDTEVTLAYPLYRSGDPLCCPGAGEARVRFQLNNGKLTALDPIPPLRRSRTQPSRY